MFCNQCEQTAKGTGCTVMGVCGKLAPVADLQDHVIYALRLLSRTALKARAKGVIENNIALHHVFRNAMVPLVQYIPSAFLNTVVGSIYIESLYSIPGMGGLLVTCVQRHDNTMVQGIVLLYACVGIIGLILGDVLMVLIDPRINFGKKEGGR